MDKTRSIAIDSVIDIVEANNCIYNPIITEDYKGMDGIIELIYNEKPLHKTIAINVQSIPTETNFEQLDYTSLEFYEEYFDSLDLPLIIVAIKPDTRTGYWFEYVKGIPFKKQVMSPKLDREFSFAGFNRNFLNYFLLGKDSFYEVEKYLRSPDREILRSFFISTFNLLEYAIPYVLLYPNSKDYFKSLEIKVFPAEPDMIEITKYFTKESKDVYMRNDFLWYVKDENGNFRMPLTMFIYLSNEYNLISKKTGIL
ncbi:hypothetical protein ERX46_01635 [Brumimicrobium glaciale]|uniref:DUF4365 domain-containing protein n=1 Tax=Brumimicrobium glaciale TaxID=200475 RepID=A0A4V1WG75_9FLAO|nr:hypothetical protein [Brumimicrobium glaciale]RYM35721.1 hypothetical protein ERX46_01635 [Brumimicrobium glaciale]